MSLKQSNGEEEFQLRLFCVGLTLGCGRQLLVSAVCLAIFLHCVSVPCVGTACILGRIHQIGNALKILLPTNVN